MRLSAASPRRAAAGSRCRGRGSCTIRRMPRTWPSMRLRPSDESLLLRFVEHGVLSLARAVPNIAIVPCDCRLADHAPIRRARSPSTTSRSPSSRGEVFGPARPQRRREDDDAADARAADSSSSGTVAIDGPARSLGPPPAALRAAHRLPDRDAGPLGTTLTVDDNLSSTPGSSRSRAPASRSKRVLRLFELWDRRGDRVALLSKG